MTHHGLVAVFHGTLHMAPGVAAGAGEAIRDAGESHHLPGRKNDENSSGNLEHPNVEA